MRLSEHFKEEEFTCHCCGRLKPIPDELIAALEAIREKTGPIHIVSGYRCPRHNSKVGGAKRSQHMNAAAADFKSELPPSQIFAICEELYPNTYGLGLYEGWVHIDTRKQKARWRKA